MKMANGLEAFETYLALKMHFDRSNKYDYFVYNGKTRVNMESFRKRKDSYFFEKAAKNFTKDHYILRVIVDIEKNGSSAWIRNIFEKDVMMRALMIEEYRKRYLEKFEKDMSVLISELLKMKRSFKSEVLPAKNDYPVLLKKYIVGAFLPEFLIGLNSCLKLFKFWDKRIGESNPVWEPRARFLRKYIPFIEAILPDENTLIDVVREKVVDIFEDV